MVSRALVVLRSSSSSRSWVRQRVPCTHVYAPVPVRMHSSLHLSPPLRAVRPLLPTPPPPANPWQTRPLRSTNGHSARRRLCPRWPHQPPAAEAAVVARRLAARRQRRQWVAAQQAQQARRRARRRAARQPSERRQLPDGERPQVRLRVVRQRRYAIFHWRRMRTEGLVRRARGRWQGLARGGGHRTTGSRHALRLQTRPSH